MNIRHYISALCCAVLLVGCSDDPVGSTDQPGGGNPSAGQTDEPNTPQPIQLNIGAAGLSSSVQTRGYGMVGDLQGSQDNVWHKERLYIYAVNRYATDLSKQYVDADEEIPTFVKGGFLQQEPTAPWGGDPALAPSGQNAGAAEFVKEQAFYNYYPLNGAYNFMGYHIDDAKVLSSGLTADKKAIELNIEIDGTQDVMISTAQLSSQDTISFILSLMNSDKLPQASIDTYYDKVHHRLSLDLTDNERAVIEKELSERHFSSYSHRRGIRPNLTFEHQLARLTFQVVGGDKDAVGDAEGVTAEPKIHFAEWTPSIYYEGDYFSYMGEIFYVKEDTENALSADLLFKNKDNKERYLQSLTFSLSTPKSVGDKIVYQNELYVFKADYDGKASKWDDVLPLVDNITREEVTFKPGRYYRRGECVLAPDGVCWIVATDVQSEDWDAVEAHSILFRRGIYVSGVELVNMQNHATLRLTPDTLRFILPDESEVGTAKFTLGQRPIENFEYGVPLEELLPTQPKYTYADFTADSKKATRVGESIMVIPGTQEFLANIYVTEYVDKDGNLVSDNSLIDGHTKVYKNTHIRIDKDGDKTFEAGGSYMVTITAYALEGIDVETKLTAWNDGGNVDVDPEDQLFEGVNSISMPVAYYGAYEATEEEPLPGAKYNIKKGKSWSSSAEEVNKIEIQSEGVHWFAIRDEYEIAGFKNTKNSYDYLSEGLVRQIPDLKYKFKVALSDTESREFQYRIYYIVDSEGNSYTDGAREYTVTVKEVATE